MLAPTVPWRVYARTCTPWYRLDLGGGCESTNLRLRFRHTSPVAVSKPTYGYDLAASSSVSAGTYKTYDEPTHGNNKVDGRHVRCQRFRPLESPSRCDCEQTYRGSVIAQAIVDHSSEQSVSLHESPHNKQFASKLKLMK